MKTVKEWLSLIADEKIRNEALENMANPDITKTCIKHALVWAFIWEETPQGKDYWDKIAYSNIELLPH